MTKADQTEIDERPTAASIIRQMPTPTSGPGRWEGPCAEQDPLVRRRLAPWSTMPAAS